MKRKETWISLVISAVFLYWAFRKSDWRQVWAVAQQVDYWILLGSMPVLALHFWFRAVRWRYLLWPTGRPGLSSLFGATMIGFMANNLLPLRIGEFVRAYVLGRKESIAVSSVFATLVVERLFDGFTILLIFMSALLFMPLDLTPEVENWVRVFSIFGLVVYVCGIVFLLLLKWKTDLVLRLIERIFKRFPIFQEKANRVIQSFVIGLNAVGSPRLFTLIGVHSLILWILSAFFYWMTLFAFQTAGGENVGGMAGLLGGMFLLGAIALGIMVPSGPGFVGPFQFACITALVAMGVDRSTAESYAIVVHAYQFITVTLAGFLCLYLQNFTFGDIRGAREKASLEIEPPA